MFSKKVVFIAAALLTLLGLSALSAGGQRSSGAQEGRVQVVLWHTYSDHHTQALDKIIGEFNASQDRVTVTAQPQPLTDYYSKLMQAVRNGTGPDFASLFPSEAVNYIPDGLLVNYDSYLSDPAIGIPDFKERIAPGLYSEVTQWDEGAVYLLPTLTTGEVFFYNKTLYDELGLKAPATWKELEENSRIIYQQKGIPGFGSDSVIDTYSCLIIQNGAEYINPRSRTVGFNNNIGLEQLTWFANCVQEGIFRLVGEDQYFSNPFGSGAVGSYIGSSAGVDFVKAAVADKFEVGCAPIPQTAGGKPYISSYGGGYAIFKSAEAKHRGAYEFLKYLTQPDVLVQWTMAFGGVPVYSDAINSAQFQAYQQQNIAVKALADEVGLIGFLPSVRGSSSVRQHIDRMIQSAATGRQTPRQALEECAAASNADLQG
ncbi:MAG: ABC transporter substrate-binding protein [Treponema sp.]|jgi:multiple sugar transport system substrate-binding protein|nr:ABC transporter substrate-binding protein [Treponema sp.]